MTFASSYQVATLEPAAMGTNDDCSAKLQAIVVGLVAAFESIKILGTNGEGFYGMNSAHSFENPTALSNFFNTPTMMIFPFALVLMYGRMLGRFQHGLVIFSVMLSFRYKYRYLSQISKRSQNVPRGTFCHSRYRH